jgi:hypothetical protein
MKNRSFKKLLGLALVCTGVFTSSFAFASTVTFDSAYTPHPEGFQRRLPTAPPAPADFDVHPDCRETAVSLHQLLNIARDPKIKNQIDFLRALPQGSMQSFTLLEKSDSPEAPCISKQFPGIIRLSITGSIAFRYTGDPNCRLYNQIQLLYFNGVKRSWKPLEIDFKKPAKDRVDMHPTSCQNCHSPSSTKVDLRPNWQEYSTWKGFYGQQDDSYVRSGTEVSDVLDIKKRIAGGDLSKNANYSELPWYKGSELAYQRYPYNAEEKSRRMDLRANMRFTTILSHRLSQRIARMIEESPKYPNTKYQILSSLLRCETAGTVNSKSEVDDLEDYEIDPLTQVANDLGLENADLTMHFNQSTRSDYRTAISPPYSGMDNIPISDMVAGQLFRRLVAHESEFSRFANYTRGESAFYGERFACIDDLGGAVHLNKQGRQDLCGHLIQKNSAFRAATLRIGTISASTIDTILNREIKKLSPPNTYLYWNKQNVGAGESVAKNICATCHGPADSKVRSELHFLRDLPTLKSKLCSSNLLEKIKVRISDYSDPMPPYGAGFDTVPTQQIQTVVDYLSSIQSQCGGN